jgi:acetyl esterase/lipase
VGETGIPAWEQRFRAPRVSLPTWARYAPDKCVYFSNSGGRFEAYAWDRAADTHRQVTDRPSGTSMATIDPAGEWIWWFDDTDGDEYGVWRRQPFGGGADEEAAPGVPAGYSAGLAIGRSRAIVGVAGEEGTRIYLVHPGRDPQLLYQHADDAEVGGFSDDETRVAIGHSEHGDSRHKALRILSIPDVDVVAELWDGPGKGLYGVAFAPHAGDPRLLAIHELDGAPAPLVWDTGSGAKQRVVAGLPGDVEATWYADGSALLLTAHANARTTLHRFDLISGTVSPVPTPSGVIVDATARPDDVVEYSWSSAAEPTAIRSSEGATVLPAADPPAPSSVPVSDAWVDGPGGPAHVLVSTPERGAAPYPTVFLVHGGPAWLDRDSYAADVAAWVDHGFAVVRVNYRGSTGYGSAWRDAIEGRPGLTELEDVAAARAWATDAGIADPSRLVLSGGSWGGYLTLLGLGTQPGAWTLGIAAVPVADYVAAYHDEMEALQAFDRSLFGGSPAEVPDRYRERSPISYVDRVRAPVLVLAGANDPRCPIRQIENYLARLAARDAPHEVYRFDAGHGSLVVDERIRQMRAELDFAHRHLGMA